MHAIVNFHSLLWKRCGPLFLIFITIFMHLSCVNELWEYWCNVIHHEVFICNSFFTKFHLQLLSFGKKQWLYYELVDGIHKRGILYRSVSWSITWKQFFNSQKIRWEIIDWFWWIKNIIFRKIQPGLLLSWLLYFTLVNFYLAK